MAFDCEENGGAFDFPSCDCCDGSFDFRLFESFSALLLGFFIVSGTDFSEDFINPDDLEIRRNVVRVREYAA